MPLFLTLRQKSGLSVVVTTLLAFFPKNWYNYWLFPAFSSRKIFEHRADMASNPLFSAASNSSGVMLSTPGDFFSSYATWLLLLLSWVCLDLPRWWSAEAKSQYCVVLSMDGLYNSWKCSAHLSVTCLVSVRVSVLQYSLVQYNVISSVMVPPGAREPWGQGGQMPRNLPGGQTRYFDHPPPRFLRKEILSGTHPHFVIEATS